MLMYNIVMQLQHFHKPMKLYNYKITQHNNIIEMSKDNSFTSLTKHTIKCYTPTFNTISNPDDYSFHSNKVIK